MSDKRLLFLGRTIIFAVCGDESAVTFWIEPERDDSNKHEMCGIEFHRVPTGMDKVDFQSCRFLGWKPCHHDGSSLSAREQYLPLFKSCAKDGDYEQLWRRIEVAKERWDADIKEKELDGG